MTHIQTEITDRIAQVTLARPEKLNAISLEMLDDVIAAAHALRHAEIDCVVLSGEGRGFCAGIDLASLSSLRGQDMDDLLLPRTHGDANRFQAFSLAWRDLPVPVIVAIHGVCFGAGMQLALGGDIRISTPDARLSVMEMKWGLIPDMGGMTLLPRLVRSDVLRRLIYTAEELHGAAALDTGLVTELSDAPLERAFELARVIAGQSSPAIRAAKRLMSVAEYGERAETLLAEAREQAKLLKRLALKG